MEKIIRVNSCNSWRKANGMEHGAALRRTEAFTKNQFLISVNWRN